MFELKRLTWLEAFPRAWLAARERRRKPAPRLDGGKVPVRQYSDAEFLAAQKALPCPLPGDGCGGGKGRSSPA